MRSQNGWLASPDANAIGVVSWQVAGVAFPNGVKGGDVETVLRYVVEEFHRTVELLHAGWCWGYYYKAIEGSTTLSNHASGTAVDINAPNHPMGVRGTFTPTQVTAIRRILNYCNGVVRWGGDYIGRPDDMHFEIDGNAVEVATLASKIRAAKEDDMSAEDVIGYPLKDPDDGSIHTLGDYVRYMEHNVRQQIVAQINALVMPKLDEISRKLDS